LSEFENKKYKKYYKKYKKYYKKYIKIKITGGKGQVQ
jgi:hypothetical protein